MATLVWREKMMEIAFLNAITKSAYMPPYDPYFAGGYINYYYYGLFITNILTKLTGILPEVAFNLAVPTFFALTVQHAFVVGYHLLPLGRVFAEPARASANSTVFVSHAAGGTGRVSTAFAPAPAYAADEPVGESAVSTGPLSHPAGEPPWARASSFTPLPRAASDPADSSASPFFHAVRGPEAGVGQSPWVGVRASRLRLWAGALSVAWVAILGNLTAPVQLIDGLARLGGATFMGGRSVLLDLFRVFTGLWQVLSGQASWPEFDYWYRATRVIPYTINEFPFFSFLFADLHPHMIAIPFTILVVALGLHLLLDSERRAETPAGLDPGPGAMAHPGHRRGSPGGDQHLGLARLPACAGGLFTGSRLSPEGVARDARGARSSPC